VPPAASPLVSAVKRHPHALENVAYAPDSFICAHVGLPTSLLNLSHSLYMALPLFVSLSLFQVFRAVQTPLLDWALDPNAQRCAHVMFGYKTGCFRRYARSSVSLLWSLTLLHTHQFVHSHSHTPGVFHVLIGGIIH